MAGFEQVLAEVLSGPPRELMFDLSEAHFISAQGYAAMGRCSLDARVTIRSRTELASRVLTAFGYDQVAIVPAQEPASETSC